jgi:trimeric autotransporter adhesin
MKTIANSLALCFILGLAACGGGGSSQTTNNGPSLTSIQVAGLTGSVVAGQTQQLTASARFSDGSTKDVTATATWSSSNAGIATVAPGGMLTAKASGQCSVSAKIGSIGGSLGVTITPALVSIAVTPATPSIAINTSEQFFVTGTYSDGSTQNLTSQVTWASSNTAVASVSTTAPTGGLALALSAGTTTISATLGSVTGSTLLTVTSATVTQITVTPPNTSLTLGLSQQYTAKADFSDSTTQDITGVAQWHSSNGNVASITVSGLVTGRTLGSVTISATFGGVTGSTPLSVDAADVSSITIKPANGSLAQGTQISFTATGTYTDGSTHDLSHVVSWSSDSTGVLTIGSVTGVGKGIAAGQANVTATLGSLGPSVPVTVTNATIVSIAVGPTNSSLPTGGRGVMTAVGTFSDSSTQNLSPYSAWSSDNIAAATVGTTPSNYGVVAGVSAGTANISATFSYAGASATGSTPLTVTSDTLASITMSPLTAVLAPGSAVGIAANGNFTDGSVEWISPLCTWTSSNNAIATVSPNGLVGGQSAGVVTITAQDGPITGTASVLVESAALSSIQVNPPTRTVPAGFAVAFGAKGTFSNGDTQNLTSFVNWTSSRPSIATISNSVSTGGVATGIQSGTTTISALFSGVIGTAQLTVSNATLTSITVMPSNPTIGVGASQAFAATGNFSDGSTLDITRQVAWDSSTKSVATVSLGLAQGLSTGTSTISASINGVTGSATLTVQ